MKVTALLPDNLIGEVKNLTKGKNLTDSLVIALNEWIKVRRLKTLSERVRQTPLTFRRNFSSQRVRELNRKP